MWQRHMHCQEKDCISLTVLLLLGLLYIAISSTGWLIALQGFMVVAEALCACVCVCAFIPFREREREMRVCLYWHSKVTAPSSAILSRTVNHWTDDLDAPVLWGAKHAHERRHTLTYTLHPHDHMFDSVKSFFIFSVKCYQKQQTQKRNNKYFKINSLIVETVLEFNLCLYIFTMNYCWPFMSWNLQSLSSSVCS